MNIVPDVHVRVDQTGRTKWDKVRNMFLQACNNKEITDDFILFNDDFFVMKPTDEIPTLYRCSLDKHIQILKAGCNGNTNEYTKLLINCKNRLEKTNATLNSYELHTPFVFNKKKLLQMLERYPDAHCTRTMYGNLYNIGGKQASDIKIFTSKPDFDYKNSQFLSTEDTVVNVNNDVWRYIRKTLNKRSPFEI